MKKKLQKTYNFLKSAYGDKNAIESLEKKGYILDKELSNDNQNVMYNKNNESLLFNIAGTHNLKDIGTDVYLAFGGLKSTNRYKEAHKVIREAKKKYNPKTTTVSGHSLGGSIAGYVASKGDRVISYNKGATIGQKTRSNELALRTRGDIVSTFAQNAKTISNKHNVSRFLKNHAVNNLKL